MMKKEIHDIINRIDFNVVRDHPNILIAARFWEDDRYHAAKVCYRFMRMIDDMIDNRKKDNNNLTCLEKQHFAEKVNGLIECLEFSNADDSFINETVQTITTYKIPLPLFHNFSRSMIHDINHNGFQTFEQFISYAEGACVAPASVFVHLCCLEKKNGEYIPPAFNIVEMARPCAIFSYLVHIIRDFQKDQHHNLNYFPMDILKKNSLLPEDLKGIAHGAPIPESFRNVVREYCMHAEYYKVQTLEQIEKLTSVIAPRYLLSLHIIFNLYLQVFERIDIIKGTFTTEELNPSFHEILERVKAVINENHSLLDEN
ncbi:MAG: squalene/phytoene synthase family protein [Bacteroidales bacterium]|nr:MAG: squalene/phytoene synthase family protein [Bacteroidales bacterium]